MNLSVMGGELRHRIDSGRVGGRNRIAVISGWWVLSCMVKGRRGGVPFVLEGVGALYGGKSWTWVVWNATVETQEKGRRTRQNKIKRAAQPC